MAAADSRQVLVLVLLSTEEFWHKSNPPRGQGPEACQEPGRKPLVWPELVTSRRSLLKVHPDKKPANTINI